jgi:hypothetical protein
MAASSHAVAVESLRKQRKEVQSTLRTMRANLKKDEMHGFCNDYIQKHVLDCPRGGARDSLVHFFLLSVQSSLYRIGEPQTCPVDAEGEPPRTAGSARDRSHERHFIDGWHEPSGGACIGCRASGG